MWCVSLIIDLGSLMIVTETILSVQVRHLMWFDCSDTIDFVKQSAALCLLKLFRTSADVVPPAGEYASRIVHLLNDSHLVRNIEYYYYSNQMAQIRCLGCCDCSIIVDRGIVEEVVWWVQRMCVVGDIETESSKYNKCCCCLLDSRMTELNIVN
jgi:hypothetical protein